MLRLLFVTNIYNPYQDAVFAALSKRSDLSIRVVYCAASEPDRSWRAPPAQELEYPAKYAGRLPTPQRFGKIHINPGLLWSHDVRRWADVVIVAGWAYPSVVLASLMRRGLRRPYGVWAERWQESHVRNVRQRVREAVMGGADWFLGVGSEACSQAEAMGIDARRILNYPYVPAVERIVESVGHARGERVVPRKSVRILFVGQLIERKGVDVFMNAVERLWKRRLDIYVDIAGSGPMGKRVAAWADESGGRVVQHGHCGPRELAELWGQADMQVVPSRYDGWGVVVHEAMAAGLPVVLTREVGATELCRHESEGLVVPSADPAALADAIARLAKDPVLREALGRNGRERALSWSPPERAGVLADFLARA